MPPQLDRFFLPIAPVPLVEWFLSNAFIQAQVRHMAGVSETAPCDIKEVSIRRT